MAENFTEDMTSTKFNDKLLYILFLKYYILTYIKHTIDSDLLLHLDLYNHVQSYTNDIINNMYSSFVM